jgi:hypothetical protein
MSKLTALQRHFVTEEIEQDYDTFTVDGTEYLVLTIDEVNDRAYEYVKENIVINGQIEVISKDFERININGEKLLGAFILIHNERIFFTYAEFENILILKNYDIFYETYAKTKIFQDIIKCKTDEDRLNIINNL